MVVPDCPNAPVLLQRIRDVVGDDIPVEVRVLDPQEPMPEGFAGSPTLLVDGENAFAAGDPARGAACVLRLPSTAELRAVLLP